MSTVCKKGGREYNQDYLAAAIGDNTACFVVCDGLGSYVGSEVASSLSSNQVIKAYKKHAKMGNMLDEKFMIDTVKEAHNFVTMYKETNPKIASSCTTIACVFSDSERTAIAHIGDSRVYMVRQGKIMHQTKDHSLAQMAVDVGEISQHTVRQHKDQNKLTRVLGSEYFAAPDIRIIESPLQVGDGFLLCTDGWWEYVYEDEIEAIFSLTNDPQDAITRMEKRLNKRAPSYNDNFSAIIAMVV